MAQAPRGHEGRTTAKFTQTLLVATRAQKSSRIPPGGGALQEVDTTRGTAPRGAGLQKGGQPTKGGGR